MTAQLLARQFGLNHSVAHANAAGITHEESLIHPQLAGNCLNWVLGHVVATRNTVTEALGEPPIWDAAEALPYARGARPPLRHDAARPLPEILAALDRAQQIVDRRLRELSDADLQKPLAGDKTLGEWLAALSFHESYHVGQCGLLRRLLGKAGAIA